MKRIRLAAALAALLPGIVAGCSSFGDGPIMSRLRGSRPECPCEEGIGPCCDGPALGDGLAVGPTLAPGVAPAVPAIGPAPRILLDPAQAVPAGPTSRTKSSVAQ
jgi:hypothetical protein